MTNQKDQQDINKKRKNEDIRNSNGRAIQIPRTSAFPQHEEDHNGMLDLSLGRKGSRNHSTTSSHPLEFQYSTSSTSSHSRRFESHVSPSQRLPPQFIPHPPPPPPAQPPPRPIKQRRNPSPTPREGKSETIPPPFEWATDRRATVHTLEDLLSKEIFKIKGDVQCKRCEHQYEMEFDLRQKFSEVAEFIWENKAEMHQRAPEVWKNPILPTCRYCEQENSAKPVIGSSKKAINWLFLLLGQMLGCCTLEQLRYFCKHTKNHRTGAKDRVLYLTYLSLCKQLHPNGPFDR